MPSTSPLLDQLIYKAPKGEQASVAVLLDEARKLLVAAWDSGREPTHLVVPTRLYRVLLEAKAAEIHTGMQLSIFGLFVMPSEN